MAGPCSEDFEVMLFEQTQETFRFNIAMDQRLQVPPFLHRARNFRFRAFRVMD